MAKRYELTDAQWTRIADLLPCKARDPGRTAADNRLFVNGVLWVLRSGAHWRDLPERYGKPKSVHKRFSRWATAGVWERVFAVLTADRRNEHLMLDTTLVRAHRQRSWRSVRASDRRRPAPKAAGRDRKRGAKNQAMGRSRGGLTTKIHLLADALGRPLRIMLTPGQAHDVTAAPALLEGVEGASVIADRSYDTNDVREIIAEAGMQAVIPS